MLVLFPHGLLTFGEPGLVLGHTSHQLLLFEMEDREGLVKGLLIFGESVEVEFGAALIVKEEVAAVFKFQRGI